MNKIFRVTMSGILCGMMLSVPLNAEGKRGQMEADGLCPVGEFGKGGPRGFRSFHGSRWAEMGDPALSLVAKGKRLGLTEAQEKQLLEISQKYRSGKDDRMEQVGKLRQDVSDAMHAEPFDEDALRKALDAMHPIISEGMVEMGRIRAEIAAVLTEEQKGKLKSRRDGFRTRYEERKGRREVWEEQDRPRMRGSLKKRQPAAEAND